VKKVFIDTDCGVDDAVAIAIALAHPELEVVGLSTVNGNVGVEQVSDNVLRLLPFLGKGEIPVYGGASHPLVAQPHHAAGVHGSNGLGEVELPVVDKKLEPEGAVDGLLALAREQPGFSLVALGPLTNVALALKHHPELEGLIGEIVSMGGALQRGNVTPHAEFNYYADPESVRVVLESKVPLTVVLWDAALKMAHTEEEIRELGMGEDRIGKLVLQMHQSLFSHMEKVYGQRIVLFPDPLTMAFVADPDIARQVRIAELKIELSDSPRRGATVERAGKRAILVLEIDKAGFESILLGIRNLA
jgi:inosine-uridine nucleoside N-ribohydrolase